MKLLPFGLKFYRTITLSKMAICTVPEFRHDTTKSKPALWRELLDRLKILLSSLFDTRKPTFSHLLESSKFF